LFKKKVESKKKRKNKFKKKKDKMAEKIMKEEGH